jgi:soluble P-type ATPase
VWDSELFRAQYQDWFDMVVRQRELNTTTDDSSLSQISETIREAEIELSIAMASASQLELVRQRLEALNVDKNARYIVLAQIVNDVALRELNENVVVLPATNDMSLDFPKLSTPGLFGKQLVMSREVLPL